MKINEILEKYKDKEFDDKIVDVLKKHIKEEESYRGFKNGDGYWYINCYGGMNHYNFESDDVGKHRIDHCYGSHTEEECEFKYKQAQMLSDYKAWCKEKSDLLNWEDGSQFKYYVYYDYSEKGIGFGYNVIIEILNVVYASSEQIHQDFIDKVGEEDFVKYIGMGNYAI